MDMADWKRVARIVLRKLRMFGVSAPLIQPRKQRRGSPG